MEYAYLLKLLAHGLIALGYIILFIIDLLLP
jgi:hypothetical protein